MKVMVNKEYNANNNDLNYIAKIKIMHIYNIYNL